MRFAPFGLLKSPACNADSRQDGKVKVSLVVRWRGVRSKTRALMSRRDKREGDDRRGERWKSDRNQNSSLALDAQSLVTDVALMVHMLSESLAIPRATTLGQLQSAARILASFGRI